MIYQNPLFYEELNDDYLHYMIGSESIHDIQSQKSLRGKQSFGNYESNEPILNLLIRALHALFR